MPEEEEKKHHKRLVTEEITNPAAPSTQESITESEVKESENVSDPKPFFGVVETDNFDPTLKKPEGGVFFKFFLVTFFATLLALAFAGGVYVYLTGVKGINIKKLTISETPLSSTETSTPSPSPMASVDYSTFKVSVLNGNGGIGVATAAKTIIEKAGFKVGSVGNADSFDFTDTVIQVKSNVTADVVATLKNALTSNYSVKIGEPLDTASSYDIVVTVGSK